MLTVGEGARQPGRATEATAKAPARHGGRVERRAARDARRRLAPYARGWAEVRRRCEWRCEWRWLARSARKDGEMFQQQR
jgi:hypothetical protein